MMAAIHYAASTTPHFLNVAIANANTTATTISFLYGNQQIKPSHSMSDHGTCAHANSINNFSAIQVQNSPSTHFKVLYKN
ncbi:hypothetical protein Ancab_040439 [Ancistrocladus abbreviatus]